MNAMPQRQELVHVNGVNVAAMFDTIDAVKQDKELATFRFRADNRWVNGGYNRSTIKSFYGCRAEDTTRSAPFVLAADEPPVLLGEDKAANPAEYLLHALAACLTTSTVYHAAARGIEIEAVDSQLEGDMDLRGFLGLSSEVRKGFECIRVRMRFKTQASPEAIFELAQYSPINDVVSKSLPVKLTIETY
ncbi:MAG TPA: OsmC family protein [Burkholderiales bacterium]|jgi:uncharacterized OsmC-like protein|nr:OsmC family protein [Burkholderiales bacterium]